MESILQYLLSTYACQITNMNAVVSYCVMTDTIGLNLVIPPILGVTRYTSSFQQLYDLNEIELTQKRFFVEQKYLTGLIPLLTLSHSYWTHGGHEAFTLPQFLFKHGGKTSSGGQERYIRRNNLELPYPKQYSGKWYYHRKKLLCSRHSI